MHAVLGGVGKVRVQCYIGQDWKGASGIEGIRCVVLGRGLTGWCAVQCDYVDLMCSVQCAVCNMVMTGWGAVQCDYVDLMCSVQCVIWL